jgi:excisionase family DNA binding protein
LEETKNKKLLTVKEAADFLRISERTIYNRVGKKAEMPFPVRPKRIGRLIRFQLSDLQKYIESL